MSKEREQENLEPELEQIGAIGMGGLLRLESNRCARIAAITFGVLVVVADGSQAQAEQATGDSLFVHVSVGLSRPLQPGAFSNDWQNGVTLAFAAIYRLDARKSVFLGFEHSSFSSSSVLENPEMRLATLAAGLVLYHQTRLAAPYARVGAGVVRQGLRRMTIEDGTFQYLSSVVDRVWSTGISLNAAVGTTIKAGRSVFPYVEVSYLGSRAAGVTVGHVTVRAGLGVSLSRFFNRDPGNAPG